VVSTQRVPEQERHMIDRSSGQRHSAAASVVQCSAIEGSFGYIYAIGEVQARFPSLDIEKEFLQLLTPDDTKTPGSTFEQRLYNVLSRPENLYFAREMAWAFLIEDVGTYMLRPRSDVELGQLIESIKPDPTPGQVQYDVIIGTNEPLAASSEGLPTVTVNRLFHFTVTELVQKVPLPPSIQSMPEGASKNAAIAQFQLLVSSIFNDMLQLADNTGDADEHRALNYVSLTYPAIYTLSFSLPASVSGGSWTFTGVEVRPSVLGGARRIIDVILRYTDQSAGVVTRYYTSVDVTGQFPFLVTKLQQYFDR
jgi:hypothetical protein